MTTEEEILWLCVALALWGAWALTVVFWEQLYLE
jgi:hypothetical protein